MEDPLVSVIIPTKDRPEHLKQALDSVRAQTYSKLEIIVIDDGSAPRIHLPDDLDNDVLLLRLNRASGPARARNLGLERATGDYIAFLDDDDEFTVSRIEDGVKALGASPEMVSAVESGHAGWFDNTLVYEHKPQRGRNLRLSLLKEPSIALPAMMIKKDALDKIGSFDTSLTRYEDWDLWLRMTDVYEIHALETVHVRRRLHHPVPASVRLRLYRRFLPRLIPRIRTLSKDQQLKLLLWHLRFLTYRVIEVAFEALAGKQRLQRLKIRRLRQPSGLRSEDDVD